MLLLPADYVRSHSKRTMEISEQASRTCEDAPHMLRQHVP